MPLVGIARHDLGAVQAGIVLLEGALLPVVFHPEPLGAAQLLQVISPDLHDRVGGNELDVDIARLSPKNRLRFDQDNLPFAGITTGQSALKMETSR